MNTTLRIALGSDHAGFELKSSVLATLKELGITSHDFGTYNQESCDFPDFANLVAAGVSEGAFDFGVLICRSGVGMSIASNRYKNVRGAQVICAEDAKISRQHNNANVLILPAKYVTPSSVKDILTAFLSNTFEGGRHENRVIKASGSPLEMSDPTLAAVIQEEARRQRFNIELIASENFTSRAVQEAQGSLLTNKYAEGYPGKRWYGGCEFVDKAEQLAISRAKELFGGDHVNVQPHSGSQANMAVYFSVLQPGDTILTMDLAHGGHLTHGHFANFSGKLYKVVHYGVSPKNEKIDYEALAKLASEVKPKMITAGASAYPRAIDFAKMGEIARSVGAYLFVDMAHIAGLVAGGQHANPVPHADFVTTTTHKSLRGPRGGIIICKEEYAKKIDSAVFPCLQGGPLMHVIAAKATCLHEALSPQFKNYAQQVALNASTMAAQLATLGYRIVSGGTDNHLLLVDLRSVGMDGTVAQKTLDKAGITVNKNSIPFDTGSPMKPSGIRIGTPAVTTRGMKEDDVIQVVNFIDQALKNADNPEALEEIRQHVYDFNRQFPLPR